MSTPVQLLPPTFPLNACFGTEQERANAIIGGTTASIAGEFNSYVISATVPGVADHLKLWFNLNDYRLYQWDGASWITPYWNDPMGTLGASVFLPGKDAAWLATVDHDGSVAIPGSLDRTGPFWEEDVLMRGRFPLGYGTLQPSGTAIGANDTGGTDQTSLTQGQGALSSHTHGIGLSYANDDGIDIIHGSPITIPATSMKLVNGESDAEAIASRTSVDSFTTIPIVGGALVDAAIALDPVSLLNPYQAGVWAKRTARKYYSVT